MEASTFGDLSDPSSLGPSIKIFSFEHNYIVMPARFYMSNQPIKLLSYSLSEYKHKCLFSCSVGSDPNDKLVSYNNGNSYIRNHQLKSCYIMVFDYKAQLFLFLEVKSTNKNDP